MEYLAISLLIIGILLIIVGLLGENHSKTPQDALITAEEIARKIQKELEPTSADSAEPPPTTSEPPKEVTEQPSPHAEHDFPAVRVQVNKANPVFFRKKAWMYVDSNPDANYTGRESNFNIEDLSGIRRQGGGTFSYDGFAFYFQGQDFESEYALSDIDHIAFYPNCIVLVLKNNLPPVLFFTSETDSIREMLQKFRTDSHG